MPVYEYQCTGCKCRFEKMRPFSQAEAGAPCPKCQKPAKRIMSACASFSKDSSGSIAPVSGGGSSCSSCGGGSCASCGH